LNVGDKVEVTELSGSVVVWRGVITRETKTRLMVKNELGDSEKAFNKREPHQQIPQYVARRYLRKAGT
jgi:hypothetical protein